MSHFENSLAFAQGMDAKDPLKSFRDKFYFPTFHEKTVRYFTGNSLGLQPKSTKDYINQELQDWANLGVEGHLEAKNPWLPYHEFLTESTAKLVGAKPIEVVTMNSLTANLHFMMASFYKPTKERYKIIIESDAFPSDKYAVESQLRHHGYDDKEGLILWKPPIGEELLRYGDLEALLEVHGNEVALVMIGGVNYYTGRLYDIDKITIELNNSSFDEFVKTFRMLSGGTGGNEMLGSGDSGFSATSQTTVLVTPVAEPQQAAPNDEQATEPDLDPTPDAEQATESDPQAEAESQRRGDEWRGIHGGHLH